MESPTFPGTFSSKLSTQMNIFNTQDLDPSLIAVCPTLQNDSYCILHITCSILKNSALKHISI